MSNHSQASGQDVVLRDEALDGVRTRRVLAFCVDYLLIGLLLVPVAIIVFFIGIVTLGLGWFLFGVLAPLTALLYVGATLGGSAQSTIGMRMMGLKMLRTDGGRVDWMLAIVHTVLFWAGNAVLTPLILLASLFLSNKRTLHDLLLGTVVVREY
ncbi:RDD family protein [Nitratireductor basaltis]|uniref:RDD domain-containing protein n=1 Tax=Nitratireductor basaltis TaxID=472175 RepID=A0A084UBX7_9HYPH|nr:RDD family protein [Nitratireductor basaltis]KFB10463.1 RDD domain-containing protein [Nitratireductor basaltis]